MHSKETSWTKKMLCEELIHTKRLKLNVVFHKKKKNQKILCFHRGTFTLILLLILRYKSTHHDVTNERALLQNNEIINYCETQLETFN